MPDFREIMFRGVGPDSPMEERIEAKLAGPVEGKTADERRENALKSLITEDVMRWLGTNQLADTVKAGGMSATELWQEAERSFPHHKKGQTLCNGHFATKKESYRWFEGYLKGCALAEAQPRCEVFVVGDRESEISKRFLQWHSGCSAWLKSTRPLVRNPSNGSCSPAKRLIDAYSLRWKIEEFHRILKSGCRVEQINLRDADSLLPALALYFIVAWRILFLRDFRRAQPALCCSNFFSADEWRAACINHGRPVDKDPPTLAELIDMVGKTGGHMGRKKDPSPGPECLWRGLGKLQCYVEMGRALGAF